MIRKECRAEPNRHSWKSRDSKFETSVSKKSMIYGLAKKKSESLETADRWKPM